MHTNYTLAIELLADLIIQYWRPAKIAPGWLSPCDISRIMESEEEEAAYDELLVKHFGTKSFVRVA